MKKWLPLLVLASALSSCSVMMASKIEGIELDSILGARTRSQLIALGAEPLDAPLEEPQAHAEVFKILEQKGSIARACMHGLLDIGTGFLWEFAGTPIESALKLPNAYLVRVHFDADDQIVKMELQ